MVIQSTVYSFRKIASIYKVLFLGDIIANNVYFILFSVENKVFQSFEPSMGYLLPFMTKKNQPKPKLF
jgi:hypothetical protein